MEPRTQPLSEVRNGASPERDVNVLGTSLLAHDRDFGYSRQAVTGLRRESPTPSHHYRYSPSGGKDCLFAQTTDWGPCQSALWLLKQAPFVESLRANWAPNRPLDRRHLVAHPFGYCCAFVVSSLPSRSMLPRKESYYNTARRRKWETEGKPCSLDHYTPGIARRKVTNWLSGMCYISQFVCRNDI